MSQNTEFLKLNIYITLFKWPAYIVNSSISPYAIPREKLRTVTYHFIVLIIHILVPSIILQNILGGRKF